MKEVLTTWQCGACLHTNETKIKKPNVITAIILTKHCTECDSKFMIRFIKKPGSFEVIWTLLRGELSTRGAEAAQLRLEEKKSLNNKAAHAAQTKGK